MEREEIKGFLLGISVGVGLGYYLLKPPATGARDDEDHPSTDVTAKQAPEPVAS